MNSDFTAQFLYEERAAQLRSEAARERLTREALRRVRRDRSARRLALTRLTRLTRSAGAARHRRQHAL